MIRAKFKVDKIDRIQSSVPVKQKDGSIKYETGEVRTVHMSPVYSNGDPEHENTKFWSATPSGSLQLGCANLAAAEAFELGNEYYVDFTTAK